MKTAARHRSLVPGALESMRSAGSCSVRVPSPNRLRVDRDGVQISHKGLLFQWQDGKKVIVWPEELAPVKARFPTPPWNQRP